MPEVKDKGSQRFEASTKRNTKAIRGEGTRLGRAAATCFRELFYRRPSYSMPARSGNKTLELLFFLIKSCRVSTRVVDPDPDWIRIQSGLWIRIRNPEPDPDPGGQKLPTKVDNNL
jgi:hypothetical protein